MVTNLGVAILKSIGSDSWAELGQAAIVYRREELQLSTNSQVACVLPAAGQRRSGLEQVVAGTQESSSCSRERSG
jgi:hypothetical protein